MLDEIITLIVPWTAGSEMVKTGGSSVVPGMSGLFKMTHYTVDLPLKVVIFHSHVETQQLLHLILEVKDFW